MPDIHTFTLIEDRLPKLACFASKRSLGNMAFMHGERDKVVANRRRFAKAGDYPLDHVVVTHCEYETNAIKVGSEDWGKGTLDPITALKGEIAMTNVPGTLLWLTVADCLALAVIDPVLKVVAMAHAGYKEVDAGVPRLVVESMMREYGCNPKDLLVVSPPCLGTRNCRMKTMDFAKDPDEWLLFSIPFRGGRMLNFRTMAQYQLVKAGIPTDQIELSNIDTYGNEEYFSHRWSVEQNQPNGRFAMVVGFPE